MLKALGKCGDKGHVTYLSLNFGLLRFPCVYLNLIRRTTTVRTDRDL